MNIDTILLKYKDKLAAVDYKNLDNIQSPGLYLYQTWAYRIPKGWYGFDLESVPFVWAQIIQEVLYELEKVAPIFEIHQIKLKFGGLRFYIKTNLADETLNQSIHESISKLESALYADQLVY